MLDTKLVMEVINPVLPSKVNSYLPLVTVVGPSSSVKKRDVSPAFSFLFSFSSSSVAAAWVATIVVYPIAGNVI